MDSLGALALATEPPADDTMQVTTAARRERREKMRARAAARATSRGEGQAGAQPQEQLEQQEQRVDADEGSQRPHASAAAAAPTSIHDDEADIVANDSRAAIAAPSKGGAAIKASKFSITTGTHADADAAAASRSMNDHHDARGDGRSPHSPLIARTRSSTVAATAAATAAAVAARSGRFGEMPPSRHCQLSKLDTLLSPQAERYLRLPAWAELPVPVALLDDAGATSKEDRRAGMSSGRLRPGGNLKSHSIVPVSLRGSSGRHARGTSVPVVLQSAACADGDCVRVAAPILGGPDHGETRPTTRRCCCGKRKTHSSGAKTTVTDSAVYVGRLIDGTMLRYMIGQAAAVTTLVLVLLQVSAVARAVFGLRQDEIGTRVHLTAVFNTFVALQLFNLLCARRIHDQLNLLSGLLAARPLLCIVALVVVVQAILVQFGGDAFQTAPLSWRQWLGSVGVGAISVFVSMALRAASPKRLRLIFRKAKH